MDSRILRPNYDSLSFNIKRNSILINITGFAIQSSPAAPPGNR